MTTELSPDAQSAASRRLTRTGWALLAFVVLVALAMALSGWQEAVAAVQQLGAWKLLALCALAGVHYLLRALRWHLLVRADGVKTTTMQNARHFFGGFAMITTPGRVGELVRLRWLRLETRRGFGSLLPIAFADRAIELAAIIGIIALALTATNLGTSAVWWVMGAAIVVVWVCCRPKMLERVVGGVWQLIGRRKGRLFVRLRRVTRLLGPFMRPRVFLPTLLIGIIGWAFEGVAFWALLTWLDAPITLPTATAIFLTAVLSGALSGLPGGLGGTEAAAVALLLIQGVPAETAIIATAIIRVTTLWFAVLIGLFVFPVAEMRATSSTSH